VWILVFAITRYASVSSIVAAISLPAAALLLGEPWPVLVFTSLAALGVLILHRGNFRRLRAGTRREFGSGGSRRAPEPLVEPRVMVERTAVLQLAAELAHRAEALGEDVVRVDRLQVHLS
jgi:hypothetical protein